MVFTTFVARHNSVRLPQNSTWLKSHLLPNKHFDCLCTTPPNIIELTSKTAFTTGDRKKTSLITFEGNVCVLNVCVAEVAILSLSCIGNKP